MIGSLRVQRFKCFSDLKIDCLSRVTLIGGNNSVGKTSLLEAIFLFFDRLNPQMLLRQLHWRGVPDVLLVPEEMFAPFFLDYGLEQPIRIFATTDGVEEELVLRFDPDYRNRAVHSKESLKRNGLVYVQTDERATPGFALAIELSTAGAEEQVAHLVMGPEGSLSMDVEYAAMRGQQVVFLQTRGMPSPAEDAARYGLLDKKGEVESVASLLRSFFPQLRGLSVIPSAGGMSMIYADVGLPRKTQAGCVGDGFSRLLSIFLAIATSPKGVVLVDEIGGGIHHTALPKFWKVIYEAAGKYGCQVIGTTHSYEVIQAAKEGLQSLIEPEFSYVRIEKGDSGVVGKCYPFGVLGAALDRGWEVR